MSYTDALIIASSSTIQTCKLNLRNETIFSIVLDNTCLAREVRALLITETAWCTTNHPQHVVERTRARGTVDQIGTVA